MRRESHGLSDRGQIRPANEDAILRDDDLGVYIVCDGCGGRRAGDVASDIACRVIHDRLSAGADLFSAYAQRPTPAGKTAVLDLLREAIESASREIHHAALADAACSGMATTLVMLVVAGDRGVLVNAGDSRGYLLRGGSLHQLTEDHTLARDYVKMGLLSADKAPRSPHSAVITHSLGFHVSTRVDMLHFELIGGDVLLLCSDGLTAHVSREEIAAVLTELTPAGAVEELVQLANNRGGNDNISIIAVKASGSSAAHDEDVIRRLGALRRVPLFRNLNSPEMLAVMDLAVIRDSPAGERIVAEGDEGDRFFVSVSGTLRLSKGGAALALLPPGSLFGEMALVDHAPRLADVTALEPARVVSIRRDDFFALLRRDRSLAVKVLWGLCRVLGDRLRSTDQQAAQTSSQSRSELDRLAEAIRPFA